MAASLLLALATSSAASAALSLCRKALTFMSGIIRRGRSAAIRACAARSTRCGTGRMRKNGPPRGK
jgi:hypothetical protein